MTPDKIPQGAQDEALRLAALFELYATDHDPDGWPAIRQRELTAAAAELRKLLARVQELERLADLAAARERAACAAHYLTIMRSAVAAEREACLRLAERRFLDSPSAVERGAYQAACKSIAADIRARGAQGESNADQT